ncbi:MAG: hypothetical protein ABS939_19860, partial [Psychrobacillus sp.]
RTKIDYILLDNINGFEFGLVANDNYDLFEIVVIHHDSTMIRTIDYATTLEEAMINATYHIRNGFDRTGLSFRGQSNYIIPIKPINGFTVCI